MNSTNIHIALLGGGVWGRNILRDLIAEGCRVTVFDPDPNVAESLLALGAVAVYDQLPTKAEDFSGIIIASPSTTHRAVLEELKALELPFFVEKPLTTTLADAEALATWGQGKIFLMHVWRYHAGIQLLADLAGAQVLGSVKGLRTTRANWTSPRRDTDSLFNLMPHDLTMARAILGYIPEPRAVIAERHKGVIRGATALLGKDPFLIVEVSNRYERKIREVRVHCEHGVMILQDEKVDYVTLVHGDADSPAVGMRKEKVFFKAPSPLVAELVEFLEYLRGGPQPRCDLSEGLEVVSVLENLQNLSLHT